MLKSGLVLSDVHTANSFAHPFEGRVTGANSVQHCGKW